MTLTVDLHHHINHGVFVGWMLVHALGAEQRPKVATL